jgi:hypothetical protein
MVDWPALLVGDLAAMNSYIQLITCPKLSRTAWHWHDGVLVESSIHETLRQMPHFRLQSPRNMDQQASVVQAAFERETYLRP